MAKFTWKDVGTTLANVAPILGTALGGPAGGAVGALIAAKLGTKSDPAAIMEQAKADPDFLLKMQQLEQDERESLREYMLETLKAELADTQSARLAHKDHWMPTAITMVLACMVASIGAALLFYPIPADNKDMAVYLFGAVTGMFTSAVSYWIGTSRSSHNKDKLLGGQV